MKNISLRLAVLVAVLYSLFVAFILTKTVDESTVPKSSVMTVTGDAVTVGEAGLPELIKDLSRDASTTVIREERDLYDPVVKHFYLTAEAGDMAASWLHDGYPSFSRAVEVVVHANSELDGVDPRGRYYVLGDQHALEAVADGFESWGYRVEVSGPPSALEYVPWFISGSLGLPTLIILTLISLLVSSGVISQSKGYAVQRMHGVTATASMRRDLTRTIAFLAVCTAVGVAGSILYLWWYNGLHGYSRYLISAAAIFAVITAVGLAVYTTAHHLTWNRPIIEGIKGKLGFRVATPAAYLVRIPGMLLTVAAMATVAGTAVSYSEASDARESLGRAGGAATIVYDGHVSPEKMDSLAYESGKWLQEEDLAGRTILVAPMDVPSIDTRVVLVNSTYLDLNPIVDHAGNRVVGRSSETVPVLIPEALQQNQEKIIAEIRESLSVESDFKGAFHAQAIRGGQETYLYDPAPEPPVRPESLKSAVIVVADPGSGLIRDDDYMAFSTQGRVLVTNPQLAVEHVPDDLMGAWISAFVPVAQEAAIAEAELLTQLRIYAGSLVAGLVVLLTTAVGLAQIHVRGNAQSIFVRYVHGWRFFATHRWIFVTEIGIAAAAFLWSILMLVSTLSDQGDGPTVSGSKIVVALSEPGVVVALALINIAVLAAAVKARARKMIQTNSQETV